MIRYVAQHPVPAAAAQRPRCMRSFVDRLADAICELGGAGEAVTEEALLQRDFPPAVVTRFAESARAEARRRFIKR